MSMHAELACKMQPWVEKHYDEIVSLDPVDKVEVGVELGVLRPCSSSARPRPS